MKNSLFILCMLFLFNSCTAQKKEADFSALPPKQFSEALAAEKNAVLLDVRTPEEVNEGVLEGAVVMDFYAPDFSQKIKAMDPDKAYYIYCRSGNRSAKTAVMMKEINIDKVIHLDGGINSWRAEGMPVVDKK